MAPYPSKTTYMKKIDVFSFNGEFDVLELRLNILDKAVDQFILCEGEETTAGVPKPRYFEENKERYEKWLPKIKHHVFSPYTDPPLSYLADLSPGVPKDMHWWRREFIQKESMRYALTHLRDEDQVFIGDVDEIWDPTVRLPQGRFELEQLVYTYWLDNRSTEYWTGTSVMNYGHIKSNTLDNLRSYDKAREYMWAPKVKSGWHFTNIGGAEFVKRKIRSYAHQEFNNEAFLNQVDQRIALNQDYLGRDFILGKDESEWPTYLKKNRAQYAHLCKGVSQKVMHKKRSAQEVSNTEDTDTDIGDIEHP